jgi:hypothetical protein
MFFELRQVLHWFPTVLAGDWLGFTYFLFALLGDRLGLLGVVRIEQDDFPGEDEVEFLFDLGEVDGGEVVFLVGAFLVLFQDLVNFVEVDGDSVGKVHLLCEIGPLGYLLY